MARPRCARSPKRRRCWCASTRAPTAASTATACAAASGSRWQFGPKVNEAFRAIKHHLDPDNVFCPNRIVDPPRMDDASLFRFPPSYRTIDIKPVFDWSAWNVQNDPTTEAISPPGSGGDSTGGLAKAVEMCNNNGHCRKFDAGTMCPSYRVTRDEQHLTRGRANTLRLALSGQLGPDALTGERGARRARPVRRLQGLQARLPDRRRHGAHETRSAGAAPCAVRCHAERPAHRPSARLCAVGEPAAVAAQPAQPLGRTGATGRAWARAVGATAVARMAQRYVHSPVAGPRAGFARRIARGACRRRQHRGAVERHLQRVLRARQRSGCRASAAGRWLHGALSTQRQRPHAVLRAHAPGGGADRRERAPRPGH